MKKPLNRYIDHTLLKADATEVEIRKLVEEGLEYQFAALCVNGCHVRTVAKIMEQLSSGDDIQHGDSGTKIAAVVGFPLGATTTETKAFETRQALADGAGEIDMVINIGAAKDGRWDLVEEEIRLLAGICHGEDSVAELKKDECCGACLKVIIETCLLSDEEIIRTCRASQRAGADFVKTSTGFSTGGATEHHVRLMRETVGHAMKIKASGGIRTLSDANKMIEAGADRIGCSASIDIMNEYNSSGLD